jgi:hypothetical protein
VSSTKLLHEQVGLLQSVRMDHGLQAGRIDLTVRLCLQTVWAISYQVTGGSSAYSRIVSMRLLVMPLVGLALVVALVALQLLPDPACKRCYFWSPAACPALNLVTLV